MLIIIMIMTDLFAINKFSFNQFIYRCCIEIPTTTVVVVVVVIIMVGIELLFVVGYCDANKRVSSY